MSDNKPFGGPFGSSGGQYATTVQYGGTAAAPAKVSLGDAPAAPPATGDVIKDTTTAAFAADVIQESRRQPVLVDFWAPWCGPCRVVHPILEEMAAERDDLRIVSVNTDENQQTAAQYEILSIPTLILFKDGSEAKRVIGAMPKRRLESELEPALA